eukprot:CAMPEP_0204532422 /NCGR_PEP_ID=MMETSP0661-20131031/11717_1 /ASSEMBLY_ACC=CAM_ASM_000606 /TAXON_ID=109239 /ORGANISM="Alexandrium margalefi, Strain AMGDE01CS-322" /LENGTH=41 /DNA_ID= /DNA_START= /DNA_END= /DNA_ORIENTATION=
MRRAFQEGCGLRWGRARIAVSNALALAHACKRTSLPVQVRA